MKSMDAHLASIDRSVGSEDGIDLREIFQTLWNRRIAIVVTTIVAVLIAATYAFVIAKPVFESSALLLPTQGPSSDQFSAAAALLGKKSTGSADVDLYQSLLTSRTVVRKLLETPFRNESDTGKGRIEPLSKIMQVDMNRPIDVRSAIEYLSKSVTTGSKESGLGGIIEIDFSAGAPWLAQQIGEHLLAIGQEELRRVRTERAEAVLPRLAMVAAQAKSEWDSAARSVASYRDRNRSIILPEQMLQLSRLQMEQQVREQKYMLSRKEYELQALERAKAAPPMMILDPADLPVRKKKPKRLMILVAGMVLGFVGGCVGALGWKSLEKPAGLN